MKATDKSNEKKRKIKKKPIDKAKKKQVVVVAQEIKFARLLSGNEKRTRDRVLRALKKWLLSCFEKNYEFKEDDFTRVWKGLFYAVWMSDKPLVQEDLCESIAGILDLFPEEQLAPALLLVRAGFRMLATEWFGLDQHRIDKFLMLARRYLRGALRVLRRCAWRAAACAQLADALAGRDGIFALETPLHARNATSLMLHITDCYLEEISKVSSGDIPPASLCALLRPFLSYLALGSSLPLCVASRRLVADLMKYGETEGENEEIEQGFDDENGDEAEDDEENEAGTEGQENGRAGDSDDEICEGPLDPRAGRVNVTLAELPVPAAELVDELRALLPRARGAGHRRARTAIALLEQFAAGHNPFEPDPIVVEATPAVKPTRAARALRVLEKKLVAAGDELALRGLSRKHRKRLLAKARAGLSIVADAPAGGTKRTRANGEWQVEETDNSNKETKKKLKQDNKENEPKAKKQKLEEKPSEGNIGKKQKKSKLDKHVEVTNEKVKNNFCKVKSNVEKVKTVKEAKVNTNVSVKNEKVKDKVKNDKKKPKDMIVKNKDNGKAEKSVSKSNEAKVIVNKIKKFQKQDKSNLSLNNSSLSTPKKVKFVLKNNSMQGTMEYYKSVKQSPNIPFDSSKQPTKTNLKVNTPSPINPFFKKKMTRRATFAAQIVY